MTDLAKIERITRSLAFMLRHQPEQFDLELDRYGNAPIDDVVRALNERLGESVDRTDVEAAIGAGGRRRYELEGIRIRALYGHSIEVDPGESARPPEVLYLALPERDADRALRFGLRGGRRRFLHLALTVDDARESGRRLAREYAVLSIRALDAWEEGVDFYDRYSLWLAEEVPTHLIDEEGNYDDGEDPRERPRRDDGNRRRGGGRERDSGRRSSRERADSRGRGSRGGRGRDEREPREEQGEREPRPAARGSAAERGVGEMSVEERAGEDRGAEAWGRARAPRRERAPQRERADELTPSASGRGEDAPRAEGDESARAGRRPRREPARPGREDERRADDDPWAGNVRASSGAEAREERPRRERDDERPRREGRGRVREQEPAREKRAGERERAPRRGEQREERQSAAPQTPSKSSKPKEVAAAPVDEGPGFGAGIVSDAVPSQPPPKQAAPPPKPDPEPQAPQPDESPKTEQQDAEPAADDFGGFGAGL